MAYGTSGGMGQERNGGRGARGDLRFLPVLRYRETSVSKISRCRLGD